MKNLFTIILALFIGGCVVASEPVLVYDPVTNDTLLKKFRSIPSLRVSASGQFSAIQLQALVPKLPAPPKEIWVIDLRQESHGFLNGLPVTWYADQNKANINLNAQQIMLQEQKLLDNLAQQKSVTVYRLKKLAAGKIAGKDPVNVTVQTVSSEQELVTSTGANYRRFYVLDHNRPDDQTVDDFINFVKKSVHAKSWLHFHCRGGKGRSSTFIVMYDMLLNARHSSFEEIIQRQIKDGNIDLRQIPTKSEKLWKASAAKDRLEFLKHFYDYASATNGYPIQSWQSWAVQNSSSK